MVTFAKLGQYGRMGNAMFQIAATIGYASRYNCDYIFPNWEYQRDFNIPLEKFSASIHYSNIFNEPHFHYAGIPNKPNMNLHGYFQSYKYWQDYGSLIRKLLTPKHLIVNRSDTTAIHVRRTDYLIHTGCYQILDMKYYERAMEVANTPKFLVFSDDLSWCREHFLGNSFEFSEERHPPKDLAKMIGCRNQIIANSSFSWWGAWLNPNPNKKVIAPDVWFGSKLSPTHNTQDLYLPEWIRL